jgi:hypothetical protein
MTPTLNIQIVLYTDAELERWKKGDYSLVKDCARPLKRILRQKAEVRPGRRFFGEAKVAATTPHQDAWYGSFKWLTSPRWCSAQRLRTAYGEQFRDALMAHFPDLAAFQQVARRSAGSGSRKPVGPDLWLVTPHEHRFIEVKLPDDSVAEHQLLGLALVATHLRGDRRVRVELAQLYSHRRPPTSAQLQDEFRTICERVIRRAGLVMGDETGRASDQMAYAPNRPVSFFGPGPVTAAAHVARRASAVSSCECRRTRRQSPATAFCQVGLTLVLSQRLDPVHDGLPSF